MMLKAVDFPKELFNFYHISKNDKNSEKFPLNLTNSYKYGNCAYGHRMIRQMFALKLNILAPARAEILTLCISSISVWLLITYRVSVCFAF